LLILSIRCKITLILISLPWLKTLTVMCQETNGPGPTGRLNRPVRVRFRDKIESLLRGQVILSI
jgi:hypothetical protein